MRRIDEQYLQTPFYGSRKMAVELGVNRKRVQRLMRLMGLEAIYPQAAHHAARRRTQDLPVFTAECGDHAAQPGVGQRHHVHSAAAGLLVPGGGDGLVQPLRAGVAVVEHAGGKFLRRGVGGGACDMVGRRSSTAIKARSSRAPRSPRGWSRRGVAISMDGRGRALDNVFVERLWRSVKYEEVYLRDYADGWEAEASLSRVLRLLLPSRASTRRSEYRTPAEVYREAA